MIETDNGKPMSILEYISDAPRDAEPYIEYLIKHYTAHRAYWETVTLTSDGPNAKDCVLIKIDCFLIELDSIQRKLQREKAERHAEVS